MPHKNYRRTWTGRQASAGKKGRDYSLPHTDQDMSSPYFVPKPFESVVYALGKKGDPVVHAPNGIITIVQGYEGDPNPYLGRDIRVQMTSVHQDGDKAFAFGKFLGYANK